MTEGELEGGVLFTDSRTPKDVAIQAERYIKLGQFLRIDDPDVAYVNPNYIVSLSEKG